MELPKVEQKIVDDVTSQGWHVIMVEATDYLPSFAYTIGLWKNYGHPEIIAFGLTVKTLHLTLNIAGESVKEGKVYEDGTVYDEFFTEGNAQMIVVDIRNISDYFGYALWFNEQEFPALQLVWTDRNQKFPWNEGFESEFKYRQPLLDRNAEFKFREEKNLAVFTTRQWVQQNKPIIRVVHDEDGDWQFLTGDQLPDDIKVVGLEYMVLSDPTLNNIFNLDYGEAAERDAVGSRWRRSHL